MSIKVTTNIKWNGKDVKVRGANVVRKSPYEAGLIIQNIAVNLCPVGKYYGGTLKDSITVRTNDKTKSEGAVLASDLIGHPVKDNVAYVGTNVKYSKHVEYGTAPHAINSHVLIGGKWVYIGMHPGTQAQPFMRPAVDLTQGKVLTAFKKTARKEFKEYFKEK